MNEDKRITAYYQLLNMKPIYPSKHQLEAETIVAEKAAMRRTMQRIWDGDAAKAYADFHLEYAQFATALPWNGQLELPLYRDHVKPDPTTHLEVHRCTQNDSTRIGLEIMDDQRKEVKTIKIFSVLDDLMEITHATYEEMYDLELMQTAEVDGDIDMLNRVLRSARRYAKGKTQKLDRTLKDKNKADDAKLGVMYSASLFRTPVTEKGRLDIKALRSTSMDVTTEFLSFGGYDLGAPAHMEEYAVLHLHSYRTDKVVDPVTKAKTEVTKEIDLGLWFDLNPVAVRMNTAVRKPSKDVRLDLIGIAEAQESSLQKSWKSNIMESHSSWCRAAQLHVQIGLGDYAARIDRKTAEYVRIGLGLKSINDVNGVEVDLTGYPMVNGACRPRVTLYVCKEEGVQQSISISPFLATLMGRDNDGDVCALHNAYVSMNGAVRDLLHSLTQKEDKQ